jgi:citrate lyase subunit beta/citryl-CoA lyase
MSRPFRLRRSELSTPGTSQKMMEKAAASAADLVFLDLEDAVAPSEKEKARQPIVEALNGLDWGTKTRAVRVNSTDTKWCHDDLVEVITGAGQNVDVVIIPKVKAPREVWFVDTILGQLELKLGLEPGRIGIEILIEETEALARVEEIAGCCPRLEALILGVGDLSASQGMRLGNIGNTKDNKYPGDVWHYARTRMIVAARANGLDAIDGPFGEFKDTEGYRREAEWVATLGALGKWCIHPSQIEIANDVFSPTEKEIARAQRIIQTVRDAEAQGHGAASDNGMMVDAATTRIFETVLERARRTGRIQ